MVKAEWSAVAPLLRCPSCSGEVDQRGVCAAPGCQRCGEEIVLDGDVPVLIAWSRSLFTRDRFEAATSSAPDPPPSRVKDRLRSWAGTDRRGTVAAASRFVAELEQQRGGRRATVLVVGGGTMGEGTSPLYLSPDIDVIGLDVYPSALTHLVGDAHDLPFQDHCVDAVVTQAVLEHVLDPVRVVAEIHRVLRPDGLVLSELPFMQQVHEGAYDFTRYTPLGHRWLMRGFDEIDLLVTAGPGEVVRWSVDYYVRGLTSRRSWGFWSRAATRVASWSERFMDSPQVFDGAGATAFVGRRRATPLPASELTALYRGAQLPPARSRSGQRN